MDLTPYGIKDIIARMNWTVLFHDAFDTEFSDLKEDLQDELLAHARLLAEFGPNLGRPTVDTLKGSRHTNMKELRFSWNGQVWRVAFALIPNDRPSCWLGATKAAPISAGFTNA